MGDDHRTSSGARRALSWITPLATAGAVPAAVAWAGAPWWVTVIVAFPSALFGGAAAVAQAVMPQNSRDRVKWLRTLLHHRERMANRREQS